MMGMLWVVLFVALAGPQLGYGLPVRSTPQAYPHDSGPSVFEGWGPEAGAYAVLPALALVVTAVGLLLGCTWCYRHKDCKPNEGADNQLFTASATQLHDARRTAPADSGLPEPANNNISEDNNNGPISLREMQNIANNNAAAYIVSENEERNRASRESVVEFEPLPAAIRVPDPLEHCADWFGGEDVPRNRLQYLREIGRGWFGRVVEAEMEADGATRTVAVNILNQNASLEDKARFLTEARVYRDMRHENLLALLGRCLQEDPWILIFELYPMDLRQYLVANRPKMAALNESGVPLRLMCDVSAALAYLHSRGYYLVTGPICSDNVVVRETANGARAVLGNYTATPLQHEFAAPETRRHPPAHTASSEVWSLGTLIWEVCAWGAVPRHQPPPPPDLACPYRTHLYQVMQLCWNPASEARPTAAQVHALLEHLRATYEIAGAPHDSDYASTDFEERWQRLKPNTIPKLDEHVAIVHAPSTSMASHFTGSDQEFDNLQTVQDSLSVDIDTAVSRSSSIMSDKDPLSVQIKSESLTNLHGSLEDVRNIYLTHNETAVLDCHQGNIGLDDMRDRDPSDSSMDPWLKDIIAGSQDDVSYYKDVSDVIKNLDNILNSEKTSSSESSHQASPSRDNLSLDCKKEYPVQSSMVKSPGISNFQNVLEMGFDDSKEDEPCGEEEVDRDTIGTLSHSFERHSDTTSQHTLENLTPDTPIKDIDVVFEVESQNKVYSKDLENDIIVDKVKISLQDPDLPKEKKIDCSNSIPKLKDLCVASMSSVSETNEQLKVREDCETPCDKNLTEIKRTDTEDVKTKSIDNTTVEATQPTLVREVEETNSLQSIETNEILGKVRQEGLSVENKNLSQFINVATESTVQRNIPPHDKTESNIKHESEIIEVKPLTNLEEEVLESETIKKPTNEAYVPVVGYVVLPAEVKSISPEHSVNEVSNEDKSKIITDSTREEDSHISGEERIELIIDCTKDLECDGENKIYEFRETIEKDEEPLLLPHIETPESVQNNNKHIDGTPSKEEKQIKNIFESDERVPSVPILTPDDVQNITTEEDLLVHKDTKHLEEEQAVNGEGNSTFRSKGEKDVSEQELSTASTVYMDLINNTNSAIKDNTLDNRVVNVINSLDKFHNESTFNNESTIYLDLPSVLQETFLHSERLISSQHVELNKQMCASTPKGSDVSADNTLESSTKDKAAELSDTKVANDGPEVSLSKFDQRSVPDSMSPFESPTKSHHTDTYDENSSVVLGPFENCTVELFKGVKTSDLIDLPKEELLAFSSNFSDIHLETPSPLRDGNFLNEVPDIAHDDLQFDDTTTSDSIPKKNEPQTDNTEETDESETAKHVSPSTPPNSPGIFLASTSQQAYLVDIDLETPAVHSYPPIETDSGLSSLQKEIDLNQIELQITSKLAIAENENNMNIEYSGPLTVEGLVSEEGGILRESDAIPESILAGNGGSVEELRALTMDEDSMQALRNELELKLPLAQVAAIEPACDGESEHEWSELPPPPELVVSYCGVGALSPIAEETRHQLSAYENDAWNTSTRTDSSESYPEPCNNSTDEVTDLPTGGAPGDPHEQPTLSVHSADQSEHNTYTIQKDIPSSKEMTMSADSLNGSPYKKPNDAQSPIDDRTFNKNEDEKESNCERISQVSPFVMSPITDTSAPADSNGDNATGVSTLSKTTAPTDANLSKPSECLSKATSIDSWCSNDTLYNVEENFDDLVLEPDVPLDFEPEKPDKSGSTETLTHNDEEKEQSNCSTYIVHDSKSDASETFSPDSITANDNHTYTKVKTEAAVTTEGKSDVNDSAKNTQTKDLAYGTLPSYSNCTTELMTSMEDAWKLPQPELIRRSPIGDEVSMTPPKITEKKKDHNDSPLLKELCIKKMDSVDISFLQDDIIIDSDTKTVSSENQGLLLDIDDSPKCNYNRNMTPSVTSTPLTETVVNDENVDIRPMCEVPYNDSPEQINNIPNFQMFLQSAEIRPQDVSPNLSDHVSTNQDTDLLLEGDSKTLSKNSDRDGLNASDRTPTYSDFENSAVNKPQDVHWREKSSHSLESGMSSGDFRQFENSVRDRPQDLSFFIDASSMLLSSERKSGALAMVSAESDQTSQSGSRTNHELLNLDISPPNVTNLKESQQVGNMNVTVNIISDFDLEEETDQPHSIIITDIPIEPSVSPNKSSDSHNRSKLITEVPNGSKESNITYDSHEETKLNDTFDSHVYSKIKNTNEHVNENMEPPKMNGHDDTENLGKTKEINSPKIGATAELIEVSQQQIVNNDNFSHNHQNDTHNGSLAEDVLKDNAVEEIKCNGNSENYAIITFLNESFEELIESNVDGNDVKDNKIITNETPSQESTPASASKEAEIPVLNKTTITEEKVAQNDVSPKEEAALNGTVEEDKVTSATENFLKNEKKFCQLDPYFPLLSDIRFTGPATEIMSTSFSQDSPTDPTSPECEQDNKPDTVTEILKEWDSDSDSHSSNSSSGEFIWKGGDGRETALVPNTHFDHQRGGGAEAGGAGGEGAAGGASGGSGDSGSGSEGDEVEFVPSSWDCRAAPAKSSLRSLEQAPLDNKKRVVFKRQKYHCVYEYPREAADVDTHSPAAYLPDLSTYCEWDPTSAEDAELGYGQLFGAPLDLYPLRAGIAFGADFDEDFFISSSARPFESLGIMSTTSQFFPGMHVKPSALLERDLSDDVTDEFPPPPSPLPPTALVQTRTPSLDFTTPDSGVEDITPGSTTTDEDFKAKKLPESELSHCWRPVDSGSSSESVSPSSPGGEALGGLRHTRDKLKLDLPPSPHIPSPRHNRVFNFVLDKPKRHRVPDERPVETGTTPLVMSDETPIITTSLPLQKAGEEVAAPEPTFSTFGKGVPKNADSEQKIILTDDVHDKEEVKEKEAESPVQAVEAVKGEGTVLDSGDEDSGIESSSKATLERNKTPNIS